MDFGRNSLARVPLRAGDPVRISHYQLTARLGSGGMGVVYLGVAGDGSQVAVKVLRPELADDPEFRHRFRREVSVLMRVMGVCTVRVIEADTESPRPFMVTEYAAGPSLAEYIDMYGLLAPDMLYGLATGLAEALTVIHAAGIVHRDLKPSNVILADSGPKVIDFGIAQALDTTSMTKTGMMVGSAGFMAPEQVSGRPGPAADIFVWGVTVAYAATGQSPFGTGEAHAILYRVVHGAPDIAAVPEPLRPLVAATLAKDPERRPTAQQLLDRLTSTPMRSQRVLDSPTQTILADTWRQTEPHPARPGVSRKGRDAERSLLLDPAPSGAGPPDDRPPTAGKGRVSRHTRTVAASALAIVAVTVAVVIATLAGRTPKAGPSADEGGPGTLNPVTTNTLPTYPGQLSRGVFQTIQRIAASGNTMVTTGSQTTDGVVRQQFLVSTDAGRSWHLAPVQLPGGGQPPLGYPAVRIAGGPHGWMAEGQDAIWTSPDGRSWTLSATHGITPQQPGDSVNVVTSTPDGFLAAGNQQTSAGQQAVIWTSHDGLTWHRLTAAQLGLAVAGVTPRSIDFATSRGTDTVITDGQTGAWLSINSGSTWTPVTVPVDHGAQTSISGVSFDGSGLIAVRPGRAASGAADGVAYFSPDGQAWHYAGTIDAAGGWSPAVVKGSDYGFVVTGTTTKNQYVAYTSTGTGGTWLPTGSLGDSSTTSKPTAAVGPGEAVVAIWSANATRTGQQALFVKADMAGAVQPVSLAAIPGGLIPEEAVKSAAVASDGTIIAVGSADGYPAVWQGTSGGAWRLVSSLTQASADPGLAGLSAVTRGPDGWLAAGTGPFVLTSTDGTTWRPAGAITRDLAGVSAVQAAGGAGGYVIAGQVAEPGGAYRRDIWWSRNLKSWTEAHDLNETSGPTQVLAVAAGPSGFVSAGSADNKPAVWISPDGRAWTTVNLQLPGGASAGVIQQVAVSGSRVVALGQQTTPDGIRPLAERSTDGGLSWQLVPFSAPAPGITFTALTSSSGGFTAAAQVGQAGADLDAAVWTSPDGANWTQAQVSGLTGGSSHDLTALAASGVAVTGIDSVQTQASRQFVIRRLPVG
jgi:serine/threonine protein kinase